MSSCCFKDEVDDDNDDCNRCCDGDSEGDMIETLMLITVDMLV